MKNENSENLQKVKSLLTSEFLTKPTQTALQERFDKLGTHQFFDNDAFLLLSVICDLLMDQDPKDRMVDIALFIDERLSNNDSDGWRYNSMPPDPIMYKLGLQAIEETVLNGFDKKFMTLEKEQQIEILNSVQKGAVSKEIWKQLNAKLFFEELLAETAEIFFSHPSVQASINYVGMADAKGWTKIKLDQKENLENGYEFNK